MVVNLIFVENIVYVGSNERFGNTINFRLLISWCRNRVSAELSPLLRKKTCSYPEVIGDR